MLTFQINILQTITNQRGMKKYIVHISNLYYYAFQSKIRKKRSEIDNTNEPIQYRHNAIHMI